MTKYLVAILFLSVSCTKAVKNMFEEKIYVTTYSAQDKPIIGCLGLNADYLQVLWISMNCQKSISAEAYLCSRGRMLKKFESMQSCKTERESMIKLNGQYRLKTDPYEK